jgi:ribosomal protein S20
MKAHRQTIVRQAHIRTAIDAGEVEQAKGMLNNTFSLIDKMSAKGIIHDNAAGRHKSRLVKRLREKSA